MIEKEIPVALGTDPLTAASENYRALPGALPAAAASATSRSSRRRVLTGAPVLQGHFHVLRQLLVRRLELPFHRLHRLLQSALLAPFIVRYLSVSILL